MRISSAFPSNYLKAADLQGRRVRVTMSRVELEKIGDDTRPVLYFQGKEKGAVLNKTNSNVISAVYGDDTDDWEGHPIELFEAMVDFQGKTVPAIRMNVPRNGRAIQAPLVSHENSPPLQQRAPQQRQPAMAGDFSEDAPPPPQHAPQRGVNMSEIDQEVPF